jgi:hypothetical protein
MKKISILTIVLLASDAHAQSKTGPLRMRSSQELTQDSRDAAGRLDAARKSGAVEQGRITESTAADGTMAGKARQAASDLLRVPDPAETAATQRGDATLAAALKNVTSEGKALLSKGAARGATSAPPRAEVLSSEPGPKPAPLKATPLDNPAVSGSKVIITCTGAAFFDSGTSIALFTDNVEVRHPQFFVLCDEFEVHMLKDEKAKEEEKPKADAKSNGGGATKGPGVTPGAPAGVTGEAASDTEGGIKFAIARGRMVTIEKLTETGEIQVGNARHATYDGATGDILLRDFPQVQRGHHLQIATSPATTMTLKQNGALNTRGPSRTEIIQDAKTKGGSRLNSPPPPAAVPNPNKQ